MNERIKELAEQIKAQHCDLGDASCFKRLGLVEAVVFKPEDLEKFAELIVEDACRALNPMLRDMISRGQAVDLIRQHFNQRPGWVCPRCGVDRTKDVCPKGHMAAVTGDCPMIATAQSEVETE